MADYSDSVFINCPFDDDYRGLFRAIVFTIYVCGFFPRCAMEEDDALDNRINKILKIIDECKFGIHDISRTEPNPEGYPRFNMPFELGVFFGCKHYGVNKNKVGLVFERTKYSYQQTLSDLNGIDTKAHNNNYENVITQIVNWLKTSSKRTNIPGYQSVIASFDKFEEDLPNILADTGLTIEKMTFNDLAYIIEQWISVKS